MNQKTSILIVDDNLSFCKGLKALLDIQPDMVVAGLAHNGNRAMDLAGKLQPEVILLDAQMPGMSGVEVTLQIKRRWPKMKVILMTMYSDFRTKAIEAGADAFMTKGIPPEHTLSVIRGILERGSSGKESA